ncbi:hypothetical protein D3C71_1514220 [compost metagenome]
MPITEAATSMSRIAIQLRPVALRTRFLASRPSTHSRPRHSRYFSAGVSMAQPPIDSWPALTEPDEELLVTQGARLASQSMKNCAASVATARYRPRMRRLGRPKITPNAIEHRPPPSSDSSSGMPSMRTCRL